MFGDAVTAPEWQCVTVLSLQAVSDVTLWMTSSTRSVTSRGHESDLQIWQLLASRAAKLFLISLPFPSRDVLLVQVCQSEAEIRSDLYQNQMEQNLRLFKLSLQYILARPTNMYGKTYLKKVPCLSYLVPILPNLDLIWYPFTASCRLRCQRNTNIYLLQPLSTPNPPENCFW